MEILLTLRIVWSRWYALERISLIYLYSDNRSNMLSSLRSPYYSAGFSTLSILFSVLFCDIFVLLDPVHPRSSKLSSIQCSSYPACLQNTQGRSTVSILRQGRLRFFHESSNNEQ